MPISVYYCGSMKLFGEKLLKMGFRPYDKNAKTLFLGLYWDSDLFTYSNHCGERLIFWNGSDVQKLLARPVWLEIVKNIPAKHACHNEQLRDELASVGINALIRPIFFGNIKNYPISFKQGNNVYISVAHQDYKTLYGVDKVLELAKIFPEINFHIYGVDGESTQNVFFHGWVDEKVMDKEIRDFQGCIRFNAHDGFSQILIKSILLGQYPIIATKVEGVWQFTTDEELINHLCNLLQKTAPNYELREKYINAFNDFSWFDDEILIINNLQFKIRNGVWDREILLREVYQNDYRLPENPKTIIDIGAHIGGTSILAAQKGATVYSYEPERDNYNLLLENVFLNGFQDKINCYNRAIGIPGKRKLYLTSDNSGMGTFYKRTEKIEKVESIGIDEVFKNIKHCDLLKIDCEGAEYEFIKDIPFDRVDRISLELHEGKQVEILELLRKFYQVEIKVA